MNEHHGRLMRRATYASVSVAVTLISLKAVVWSLTGSVSILASLVDSVMDAGASLINLFAVAYSLSPADKNHRFGYGKAEALAGLAQSLFILASAVLVLWQGIDRLQNPVELQAAWYGIGVMALSVIATLLLLSYQHYVIRQTGSPAIRADALHYRADLLMNASIIVALLLTFYGIHGADALFGIGIAVMIGYGAFEIGRSTIQTLMDHELPDAVRREILALAREIPGVCDVHDLRTRESGRQWFIQLHLDLDGNLPLHDAHELGEEVRRAIEARFTQAEVLVHKDPVCAGSHP